MEAILGVLETLKINNTIWIQMGCFMVAYFAMSQLIFKPYYAAFLKRKERTVGGEDAAEAMVQQAAELSEKYETRAREINSEFKDIYNKEKAGATEEYNQIIANARKEAQELTESMQAKVATETKSAKENLQKEVPDVSAAMVSKLIGKDVQGQVSQ